MNPVYVVKDRATGEYVDARGGRTSRQKDARRFEEGQAKRLAAAWKEAGWYGASAVRLLVPIEEHVVEVRLKQEEGCHPWHRIYVNGVYFDGYEIEEVAERCASRLREGLAARVAAAADDDGDADDDDERAGGCP